jgi:acyl carrier protein
MEEKLLEFIKSEFVLEQDIEIKAETKLISSGIIDSFSLFSLQAFIEREFGKRIPPPLITAESFDTVKLMIEVINKF